MKNNQKKSANKSVRSGASASKGQRKPVAEKRVVSARPKMSGRTKWMIALVAGICVMAIVCATFGGILLSRVLTNPYATAYDRLELSDYLATDRMGKLFYTGNSFDFSGDEVTKYAEKNMSYMDEYIKALRLENRTLVKEGQRLTPIGESDTVLMYVTDIFSGASTDEANRLKPTSEMSALFGTYSSPVSFVAGNAYFGEDFDKKLLSMNLIPAETGRRVRNNGTISLTDTVCISYQFYKSTGASQTPDAEKVEDRYTWSTSPEKTYGKAGERLTLNRDVEAVLANALVENCKSLGEQYIFVLENYNLTGNTGDANAVYKVGVTVHYVIEEELTKQLTFTIPQDYFGQSDGDAFYALNGKEMTLRVIVVATDDYELPALDREFITETLKFEVEAKDDAGAVAEFKTKKLAEINESMKKQMYDAKVAVAFASLASKASKASLYLITEYGSSLKDEVYYMAVEQLESSFIRTYGYLPTSTALNAYATALAASEGQELEGYQQYASFVVQNASSNVISQELIMHFIFEKEGMKITSEELEKAVAERIDEIHELITDKEETTKEEIATYYGETALHKQVRRELMYRMVGDFLLANNKAS